MGRVQSGRGKQMEGHQERAVEGNQLRMGKRRGYWRGRERRVGQKALGRRGHQRNGEGVWGAHQCRGVQPKQHHPSPATPRPPSRTPAPFPQSPLPQSPSPPHPSAPVPPLPQPLTPEALAPHPSAPGPQLESPVPQPCAPAGPRCTRGGVPWAMSSSWALSRCAHAPPAPGAIPAPVPVPVPVQGSSPSRRGILGHPH